MFSSRQLKFFKIAEELAHTSIFVPYRIGCIAVLHGKIISSGINSYKTHPIQAKYNSYRNFNCYSDPINMNSRHAEIDCLASLKLKDSSDYKHIELYICRVSKSGKVLISRPCIACFNYIKDLGIRDIYYSTDYGYAYESIQ